MNNSFKLQVVFYRSDSGNEPVRDWLKKLDKEDRRIIGSDIKTIQFGWPLGMPLVRKLEKGLWEVRIQLDGRQAVTECKFFQVQGRKINLTAVIHRVFRGSNFFSNAVIGKICVS